MKRIMVTGISAGVGKSTFARRLGEALDMQVYHLDTLYWNPGWVEASIEEFTAAQRAIVCRDQWIIEGNYSHTYDVRAEHADTFIYLELPLAVCLCRVLKRWSMNIGKTRPDMGAGCKEKLDWGFIKFICKTYYPRKRQMEERLCHLEAIGSNNTIVRLQSKHAIKSYLENIRGKYHSLQDLI